jgi:cyclophilin family peptidyl-prolyl cis-trans isomerase
MIAACDNAPKSGSTATETRTAAAAESKPAEAPKAESKPVAKTEAPKPAEAPKAPTPAPTPAPAATPAPAPAAAAAPATASKAYVRMTTSKGDMIIELDRAKAPVTVDNFLAYVKKGQYDGTVFHRVIKDFMIQGGGFDKTLTEKPTGAPIKNEGTNGLSNARGTIAMARTMDPNSATAQFYINVVDNKMLDTRPGRPGYAVFGTVVEGMQVADAIRAVPTGQKVANTRGGQGPMGDVPVETVEIIKVVEIPAPAATPAK